jgi:signal transduction histidine kinase
MSIRTRLSLWYAGIMFVSLVAMGWLSYRQFTPEPASLAEKIADLKEDAVDKSDFREALTILLWCGLPAALLALVGGWWLTRKSLAPVAALTRAAERINETNFDEKLPRTEVFNAMTARLNNSFQRIREFTLHASHELKTPLTVMHGELETALKAPSLDAAQREYLTSQLDEVQRLSKIVDALTLLTKADAGQIALNPEPVRLDELVREAFEDAQLLARPYNVDVSLTSCDGATISGDRHRLRQLLLNLTDNAVKYNKTNGLVRMELNRNNGDAVFMIRNTGAGIPAESLSRVFDRFFRGDASHGKETDGCGLGLSISQWIVSAHGGTIRIESTPEKLTTVTVYLPLSLAIPVANR